MKKIGLLLSVFMVCSSLLFAQEPQFGIKAGVNLSNVTSDQGTATSARTGYHAGLLAHIHLGNSFAIQPEAVYSSEGFNYIYDDDPTALRGEHRVALDYVNIPVLVQYMPGSGFRLETGPQLGILVNTADRLNGVETHLFENNDFKSTNVSWVLGAGYMGNSGLGLDVRYNVGLTNLRNDPNYYSRVRSGVFQAGLFYQFNTGYKRR